MPYTSLLYHSKGFNPSPNLLFSQFIVSIKKSEFSHSFKEYTIDIQKVALIIQMLIIQII